MLDFGFPMNGCLKDVVNTVKSGIAEVSQTSGRNIYHQKIPGVSDFVGAVTDARQTNAKSNIFTITGAFIK